MDIENWYQAYKDRANFFFVYIREAHPTDGNLGAANVIDGILIEQAKTDEQRQEAANICTTALDISMPTILDKIDDRTANAYAAFPDRIYVVGSDGTIAFKGRPGPAGFDVPEARAALEVALRGEITAYGQEQGQRRGRGMRGMRPRPGQRPGTAGGMGVMDTNEDGTISREEWTGDGETFDRLDRNDDGLLARDEIQRQFGGGRGRGGRGADPQARFQGLDSDGDGRVSQQEFPGPAQMFETMDADGDGFITLEEMQNSRPGRGGRGRGAAMLQMDEDGDGKVSRDEWTRPSEAFDRLDADDDGFITREEMRRRPG